MTAGTAQIGRYTLLEKLATGGMAEIFLAQVTGAGGFEKTCVIKRVLPHLADAPGFTEMFLDEARLVARLNHPGIVQIFDLGREGKNFYIAMEHLAGEDASALVRELKAMGERMPIDAAVRIISAAADAVNYAHELKAPDGSPMGVVHRDISPSNLYITYQGAVKLLDFGIARAEQRLETTQVGHVKGKLAYMAPEQCMGKIVDRRADVWSLGVCLHEFLTGARLFAKQTPEHTRAALFEAPILAPSAVRPELPNELDDVVLAALERDVGRRLPSAAALHARLETFLSQRTYATPSTQLPALLRHVFGGARAEQQMARGTSQPATAWRTADLSGAPAPTVNARPSALARAPRRVWPALAAALLLVAGAVAVGLRLMVAETEVAPPAPTPAVVAEPVPAPAPGLLAEPEPEPQPAMPPARPLAPRAKKKGFLTVTAKLPSTVKVDGKKVGNTPLTRFELPPGAHTVVVSCDLWTAPKKSVAIRNGDETTHHEPYDTGTLNFQLEPHGLIFIDGQQINSIERDTLRKEVLAGEHVILMKHGAIEKTVTVIVPADGSKVVHAILQ